MKKKFLLKEIMGVPQGIIPWQKTFESIILSEIEEQIGGGWSLSGSYTYIDDKTGEEIEEEIFKSENIVISGEEVMNNFMDINGLSNLSELVKSDIFTKLPLWKPSLEIVVTTVPNQVFEKGSNLMGAHFRSDLNKKLSSFGKIEVLSDVEFMFDIIMPKEGFTNKFLREIKSTIAHELTHAYQKYMQLSKGKEGHFGKETMLNVMAVNKDSKIGLEWWDEFLYLVYLHLSFEINARVSELYYSMKDLDINTTTEFILELHKSDVWKNIKKLENFDAENFIDKLKLPKTPEFNFGKSPLPYFKDLMDSELNKLLLKQKGVDFSDKEKALKSLVKLWDKLLHIGNEGVKSEFGLDFNMLPVPNHVKENPYLFFKFFEKRFHKKAESWKKKVYRIYSLILSEKTS